MIVFVNEKNEIKAVGTTTDATLREVEITDKGNPFATWSEDRICCFKADIREGIVYGYSPYVKTTVIDKIILAEKLAAINTEVTDTQLGLAEAYEQAVSNVDDITNVELAITEVYEMLEKILKTL